MKNIVFSTTRQWNPGDEFILAGVRRVLAELEVSYNPVIYNRNPDIRSTQQDRQYFKYSKVPNDFVFRTELIDLEANIKFGFFDNSLKPDTDCSFIDLAIFAGTPEWCNGRLFDLYQSILKYNIPVLILGVGGHCEIYHSGYREVIENARLLTVRDEDTFNAVRSQGFDPVLLPCPALLSVAPDKERQIGSAKTIGLIYQATRDETVVWNGFSEDAYAYMLDLFRALIDESNGKYRFELLCHYIDEIPLARRDFPDLEVHYSYDAAEYAEIYSRFDAVIGSRVHGVGVAASLAIPGVALTHDSRGSTCKGFLAAQIPIGTDLSAAKAIVGETLGTAASRSKRLAAHKRKTMASYKKLVGSALESFDRPSYQTSPELARSRRYELRDLLALQLLIQDLRVTGTLRNADPIDADRINALAPEIRDRLINIEGKINALQRQVPPPPLPRGMAALRKSFFSR